jgi:hypothetical protein
MWATRLTSRIGLITSSLAVLSAACLCGLWVGRVPAFAWDVHFHDSYAVLGSLLGSAAFIGTLLVGFTAIALRIRLWSSSLTIAWLCGGLYAAIVTTLWYASMHGRPEALGWILEHDSASRSVRFVWFMPGAFLVALMSTLLAIWSTMQRALRARQSGSAT